jgi:CubicO group peptidase (beta-lactamase class C family)
MQVVLRFLIVGLCIACQPITASCQRLTTAKPEDVGVSAEKVEKLADFMQSLVDDGKIAGGVTMVARRGEVVHLEAVGMADRDAGKPMTTDAIFRIASMTKPITSVAVMMLFDRGRLDLDDPVSKYIPEFEKPQVLVRANPLQTRPADKEITIRHLLTHTSGLGYTPSPDIGEIYQKNGIVTGLCTTDLSLEAMMQRAGSLPIKFDPGKEFHYGMSTDVLGRVVEKVSGKGLDEFVRDEICSPLGMVDTFFTVPAEKQSRVVAAYIPAESGIEKLELGQRLDYHDTPLSSDYHLECNKYFSGGGGLCSTVNDYMRFCQMLLNGGEFNGLRLLKKTTVKLMTEDQTKDLPNNFGFGFTIFPNDANIHEQLRGAYAWFGFWSTSFRISPKGDWILITMSQLAWDDPATPEWFAEYERLTAESIED